MAVSRLLKSCATPPASRPTASIFCDSRSCSSRCRRSLMSRDRPSTAVTVWPSAFTGTRRVLSQTRRLPKVNVSSE